MALPTLWRRRLTAFASAAAVFAPTTFAFAQEPAAPAGAPAPAAPAPGKTVPSKITTTDGQGSIYIDDKLVGEGTFVGELAVGTHQLKITRSGYDTYTESFVVAEGTAVNKGVTLAIGSNVKTGAVVEDVDRPEGFYGGFGLQGLLTPGGTGNSTETFCDSKAELPTLTRCNAGSGLGMGLGGYAGYHFDPVGVELFLSGSYDVRTSELGWASSAATGGVNANPARDEEYTIRRAGGMLLARIRVTKQWKKVRLTMPIGAGIAYRVMSLSREARATEPPNFTNGFSADSETYVSPAIQLEPSIGYRLTPGVAITLGLLFSIEAPATFMNGNENPVTQPSRGPRLGLAPLSTPSYTLASNAQIFLGPTVGMMFGP